MSTITIETNVVEVVADAGSVNIAVVPTVVDITPQYGNVTLNVSDSSYIHTQAIASTTWTVSHGLGKFPAVTVIDSAGDMILTGVTYLSSNVLTINFSAAVGGVAYLS